MLVSISILLVLDIFYGFAELFWWNLMVWLLLCTILGGDLTLWKVMELSLKDLVELNPFDKFIPISPELFFSLPSNFPIWWKSSFFFFFEGDFFPLLLAADTSWAEWMVFWVNPIRWLLSLCSLLLDLIILVDFDFLKNSFSDLPGRTKWTFFDPPSTLSALIASVLKSAEL